MTEHTNTVEKNVGSCPVCHRALVAKVATETQVKPPSWVDGRLTPATTVRGVAMSLNHECDERTDDPRSRGATFLDGLFSTAGAK